MAALNRRPHKRCVCVINRTPTILHTPRDPWRTPLPSAGNRLVAAAQRDTQRELPTQHGYRVMNAPAGDVILVV